MPSSFKLPLSWRRFFSSRLPPLSLSLLLFNSACVKNVRSVSNDNFYIVRATNGDPMKKPAHQAKLHEDASSKIDRLKGSRAPTAKTSLANADLVEQNPVVAALMEKIRHNPNDPQNHYELALVCHRLRIFDTALSEYEKAIASDPENPQSYEGAGRLLRDWGTPASGVRYLQRALELRPSFAEAWNSMGTIYDELRNFSEAQRCYLKALALNPHLDFVHNNLCFSYLQTGEVKAAVHHGEVAIQLNPNLIEAQNNLGVAYGMADDFARAIEQFKRIGDEAEAHNKLGVLLLKKEKNLEALEEFKLAVRLRPFYKVAAQNYNTARSLIARNPEHPLREGSKDGLAPSRPLDTSFGADSLDFSIPLVDLRFIQGCSYLWAFYPTEASQEKLLVRPEVGAAKEYESSQVLHQSLLARN
jgi:tetratricopeptide (TPR) repeat protein